MNYIANRCETDCEGQANCGGIIADAYTPMFVSPEECCNNKLGWINSERCVAESTNTPISSARSRGWWIDWSAMRCVRDCVAGADAECGGVAESWHELYSSEESCCERLSWIPANECSL